MHSHVKQRRGDGLLSLIGGTPMIEFLFEDIGRSIWAKCEFLNPSGSIKDRLARTIVVDAEHRGLLRADSNILECTSGNTGIAFAMVGAARGYAVTIVMSERASGERRLQSISNANDLAFKSRVRITRRLIIGSKRCSGT